MAPSDGTSERVPTGQEMRSLLERIAQFVKLQAEFGEVQARWQEAKVELEALKGRLVKCEAMVEERTVQVKNLEEKLMRSQGQESS